MKYGERFVSVDEREKEFLLFCNRHSDDGSCVRCPLNNKANKRLGCAYAWLDLEDERPMDCPFCGEECVCSGGYVECLNDNCCYSSGNRKRSDAEAIAKHNRMCKAVAAYNESEVK